MGNLDKSHAARQTNVYARLISNGADILATDYPVEAAEAIKELMPGKSAKERFYIKAREKNKQAKPQKPAMKRRSRKKEAEPAQ
jgi:hypothetical protein